MNFVAKLFLSIASLSLLLGCGETLPKKHNPPAVSSGTEQVNIDRKLVQKFRPLPLLRSNSEEDLSEFIQTWSEGYASCARNNNSLVDLIHKAWNIPVYADETDKKAVPPATTKTESSNTTAE